VSSELRLALFWRFALGVGAIAAPVIAYVVVALIVDGHATKEYFEAVSQILPVLLLALAVEQRYFTRREPTPESPVRLMNSLKWARLYTLAARIYALVVLIVLGLGEWISVEVLATGSSTTSDLKNTAGSLAAGFTALIVSALVGTKRTPA
jgi:Na+/melibiose symporter-like transporter